MNEWSVWFRRIFCCTVLFMFSFKCQIVGFSILVLLHSPVFLFLVQLLSLLSVLPVTPDVCHHVSLSVCIKSASLHFSFGRSCSVASSRRPLYKRVAVAPSAFCFLLVKTNGYFYNRLLALPAHAFNNFKVKHVTNLQKKFQLSWTLYQACCFHVVFTKTLFSIVLWK